MDHCFPQWTGAKNEAAPKWETRKAQFTTQFKEQNGSPFPTPRTLPRALPHFFEKRSGGHWGAVNYHHGVVGVGGCWVETLGEAGVSQPPDPIKHLVKSRSRIPAAEISIYQARSGNGRLTF